MALKIHFPPTSSLLHLSSPPPRFSSASSKLQTTQTRTLAQWSSAFRRSTLTKKPRFKTMVSAALSPLDLTEENVKQVLVDSITEFPQIFDRSIGMTGEVDLAELDGPFVKLRLKGRFWHERSLVIARLSNYLKNRIPEILEVDIEDKKQLDDSPANF